MVDCKVYLLFPITVMTVNKSIGRPEKEMLFWSSSADIFQQVTLNLIHNPGQVKVIFVGIPSSFNF